VSKSALLPVLILTAGAALLHAQAMIEYGATAGRAAGAAGAAGAGKSAVKIFDKLSTSLAGAAKADETSKERSASPTTAVAATSAPAPAAPATPAAPPDFAALATGMDRADLFKKVGKPSMSMSSMESSKVVETCWYRSGAENVTVILRDGKVAEISGLEKSAAQ
jgi:hypothetical protein